MMMTMSDQVIPDAALKELGECLADPVWRLSNLYKILDADGNLVTFTPNRAQRRFLRNLHNRNLILKARQLGFTTFIQILILDTMLFTEHFKAGVIAHRLEDCERILRDKIKFAYERLPEVLRLAVPVQRDEASELMLANGSGVRVSTSMRSATLQFLHISEFAKIAKQYPIRAREVITGTLPAIQADGIVVIESTAEGAEGEFYRMCDEALKLQERGAELAQMQYRLHFFAWWQDRKYQAAPRLVRFTEADEKYFHEVEAKIGREITLPQRAWYILKRIELGDPEKMWQEFPSYPEEAFKVSTEGCYFNSQMADVRKQGRIRLVPYAAGTPVNTFWDLGADDSTGIWFHQQVGMEHRFLRYYEASGEDLAHYVEYLHRTGYVFGKHYLPHDADHKRLNSEGNKSIREMLGDLGVRNIHVVPVIDQKQHAIEAVRRVLPHCYFDEAGTKDGVRHLDLYRKEWDARLGVWRSQPRHDEHSHCCDAFMQYAQSFDAVLRQQQPARTSSRRTSARAV